MHYPFRAAGRQWQCRIASALHCRLKLLCVIAFRVNLMCSKQLKKSGSLVLALAPECQWVTLYNERTVAAGHRVRIHVSVFVTSQEKKFILSTESPGDHVPQGSVPVFKTGFFFLRNPNTDFKTSGTQSSFLRNRCNFCFSLTKHPLFFVSSYSLDLIIDVRSTYLRSFTPVCKEQSTR